MFFPTFLFMKRLLKVMEDFEINMADTTGMANTTADIISYATQFGSFYDKLVADTKDIKNPKTL